MNYPDSIAISAAGMMAQQTRVAAATLNLANMHSSIAPGSTGFRPLTALIHPAAAPFTRAFDAARMQLVHAELVPQAGPAVRTLYQPGHPDADAAGMVAYPAVDHTAEMLTVMTALRAYEANLAALQAARTLAAKALEIGG